MKTKYFLFASIFIGNLSFTNAQKSTSKEIEIIKLKTAYNAHKTHKTKIEKEVYDEHFREIENLINNGFDQNDFITDKTYTSYIEQVLEKFKANNKQYNLGNPHIFLIKNTVPNAASFGFDYYIMNSGMIDYLDNDYQLAAVISHEFAHNYLNHTKESLKRDVEFRIDFQKELRTLRKSELIKLIKSQDEVIQKKYDMANYSRKKEISADSLGYIFYSNLNYPKSEYLNLLNKLQELDKEEYYDIKNETYNNVLGVNGVKIKPSWLKLSKENEFGELTFTEHIDKDSIQSHPNTNDRKNWIMNQFQLQDQKLEILPPTAEFKVIKDKIDKEYFSLLFHQDKYSFALYYILNKLQSKPERLDFDDKLAKIFTKLYDARMDHKFNKYVAHANPRDEDVDYNKFLHLLWNIGTPDLKLLSEYYTKKAAQ